MSMVERLATKRWPNIAELHPEILDVDEVRWWLNAIADEMEANYMDLDARNEHGDSIDWLRAQHDARRSVAEMRR